MIEKLIKRIAQNLDKNSVQYMVIGGQAVLLYGIIRLTRDIDITLETDTDRFQLINKICVESGLKPLPEDAEDFAIKTKVLPAEDTESRIRIDFIFSFTTYEKQAFKRIKKVLMDDYPVKFASCEDVIIHKMIADRAVDREDVKNILIKNKNSIDIKYIRKWLGEFSGIDEYRQIVRKFNTLLEQ